MRHLQIFLVSLSIVLLLFLPGDTQPVSAHGGSYGCHWHYVRRGETLSGIGRRYGVSWRLLAQVNRLRNPNRIRAGSYLCIPAGARGYRPPPSYGYPQPGYPPPGQQPPPVATPPSTTTTVVQVRNNQFMPSSVTIRAGDTVVWMRAEGFHNVRADDGSFGNAPGNSWSSFSHTFTSAGTYRYHCEVHGGPGGVGMAGVVIVQ
jgi:plastocyanin